MSQVHRPKRNIKQDRNHKVVADALRNRCGGATQDEFKVWHAWLNGIPLSAIDTSRFGGEMLDWLVQVSWLTIYFEVKVEGAEKDLKPGEIAFLNGCPAKSYVVTEQNEVYDILCAAARFVAFCESYAQPEQQYLDLFFPKANEKHRANIVLAPQADV